VDQWIGNSSRWLLAAALSLAILGGCTSESTDDRRVDEHRVPDIVGLTISEACMVLSDEGYGIQVAQDVEDMSDVCAGPAAVTNQSPAPGTLLGEGSMVTVHTSPNKTLPGE
jgi:beta-lactam-binding protein with PASTA domain